MEECRFYNLECSGKLNSSFNEGTLMKFEFFKNYFEQWCYKVVNFSKGTKITLNVFDAMCSSGLYYSKENNECINGSAYYIMEASSIVCKKFKNEGKDVYINLFLNDYEEKYVNCVRCISNNIHSHVNVNIQITQLDRDEFLINSASKLENSLSYNLLIYDPYEVYFNWKYIYPFLNNINTDIVLTHFFPNEVRFIKNNNDSNSIARLEKSYMCNHNQLRREIDNKTSPHMKRELIRDRIEKIIEHLLKDRYYKKLYFYAPIVISNSKLHIYDIVCLSKTYAAGVILKDTMWKLHRKNHNHHLQVKHSKQLSLIDVISDIPQEEKEILSVPSDFINTEYGRQYEIDNLRNEFINYFGNNVYDKKEFESKLKNHKFLPTIKRIYSEAGLYKVKDKRYYTGEENKNE